MLGHMNPIGTARRAEPTSTIAGRVDEDQTAPFASATSDTPGVLTEKLREPSSGVRLDALDDRGILAGIVQMWRASVVGGDVGLAGRLAQQRVEQLDGGFGENLVEPHNPAAQLGGLLGIQGAERPISGFGEQPQQIVPRVRVHQSGGEFGRRTAVRVEMH